MVMTVGFADDLSGAAETAAALGRPARVVVGTPTSEPTADPTADGYAVTVYDCDIRYADEPTAEAQLTARLATCAGMRTFVKIDSLLRGNLRATIRATYATGRPVVLAPALPAAGRTVVDGVPLIDGRPLADTDLWQAEGASPPRHLGEFLQSIPHRWVSAEQVGGGDLVGTMAAAGSAGEIVVADAATDEDLDAIAAAGWGPHGDPATILVGTRGLAEAAGRLDGPAETPGSDSSDLLPRDGTVLVILGSADPVAHRQFDQLAIRPGASVVSLAPGQVFEASSIPIAGEAGVTAVRISPDGIDSGRSHQLAEALARAGAAALTDPTNRITTVVVIGGETARGLLDQLDVRALRIVAIEPDGVVHSLAEPPGRAPFHLVTRPGSFGAADNLAALVDRLTSHIPRKAPR